MRSQPRWRTDQLCLLQEQPHPGLDPPYHRWWSTDTSPTWSSGYLNKMIMNTLLTLVSPPTQSAVVLQAPPLFILDSVTMSSAPRPASGSGRLITERVKQERTEKSVFMMLCVMQTETEWNKGNTSSVECCYQIISSSTGLAHTGLDQWIMGPTTWRPQIIMISTV